MIKLCTMLVEAASSAYADRACGRVASYAMHPRFGQQGPLYRCDRHFDWNATEEEVALWTLEVLNQEEAILEQWRLDHA
jgi:hypothetical protein